MTLVFSNKPKVNYIRFNLTLVRHAETYANAEGIIQGILDTELSNTGYHQSRALGLHLQYHRFTHIYSSDLKRAAETARQIHLLNRVSSCEIKFDTLLRERIFGIAQGRTRQWLRELAKENGVSYIDFVPSDAETTAQVRKRAIRFFENLCKEICLKYGTSTLLTKQDTSQYLTRYASAENLFRNQEILKSSHRKCSISTENIHYQLISPIILTRSCRSSIDSTLDLSSQSSNQQSKSPSSSILSYNSSIEKRRMLSKNLTDFSDKKDCLDLDILVVSHGAVIRELIKYFACDLKTDIGQHLETIQELAPNTSITRFQVSYSTNEQQIPTATLQLIDYHNKTHLINRTNDEYNLDTTNICSF
ncbi:unnamed protein product [Rotaria magnacalcarata]|uniref:Fructose-2,6-bisphosphatase n=2 Tax=Rotaria magnacalcarata TaxID=392030 RepID=A0A816EYI0_9BILA|nr:unnamed protein product [Rotaria magnacalcarata]CAF1655714.1 unnamed protein product [Rotaria magnacalcarata]CAF2084655.1 unnamed protein product [Rotaria magnacalcarata]CAF3885342.1 unnamed protein product [Rotaria magnacalcarata]